MKRVLRLLAASLLLPAALTVGAAAADFEPVAQELSAIGMFRGTGSGFELDRAPTRAEAAIMLVRLYGAEDTASADYQAGVIAHPFTDVPNYAAPHIAWLYSQGLTKGISADKFGSADLCTAQSYATFLLRSLGYTDGVDFAYADALAFAQEKGFYNDLIFTGDFLRDDLAALTYQALAADTADGSTYLLQSLVDSGAIDKNAAAPMAEKMELYREMSSYLVSSDTQDTELSLLVNMLDTFTVEGAETTEAYTTTAGVIKTIGSGDDVEMSYEMMILAHDDFYGETSAAMAFWLKDGWAYQYMSDGAMTQTVKYPVEGENSAAENLELPSYADLDVSDIALVKSITKEKDGSDTVYSVEIHKGFGGLIGDISMWMEEKPEGDGIAHFEMSVDESILVYIVDRKGDLKGMGIELPYSISMEIYGAKSVHDFILQLSIAVEATGKNVVIEYPDFSYFAEIDPAILAK